MVLPRADKESRAVLGAILLLGAPAIDAIQAETGLRPGDFYLPEHKVIYTAALAVNDSGVGLDHLTVTSHLRRIGMLDEVGGAYVVEALTADVPSVSNAVAYATAVVDASRWRARFELHHYALEAVARLDEDAYNSITAISVEPTRTNGLGPEALAAQWEEELRAPSRRITTPWHPLTEGFNGGVSPGDTTVFSGHSSHGKSVGVAQWLHHAVRNGARAALYTNETTVPDMRDRYLASMTGIPFMDIQAKRLTTEQKAEVRRSLLAFPVTLVPAFGLPWQDIARHMRSSRWDMCALDLFNRLPHREKTSDVDAAISGLCNAAAQSNAHLLVCAQLNQERSKGDIRPPPTGRDLRESGALYNDPANVVFVHQEQDLDEDTGVVTRTGRARIWIDKARNGRPGAYAQVELNTERMTFDPIDHWRFAE